MGWFWADAPKDSSIPQGHPVMSSSSDISKCPVDHSKFAKKFSNKQTATSDQGPAVCPMRKPNETTATQANKVEELNPLNNMPLFIPAEKQPGQILDLPTGRTFSTIPRGDDEAEGVWEYPSPQQMFNAMLRKGKAEDIPEDAVESMVDVHNFLNEGAWQEILEWEKPHLAKLSNDKRVPRLAQFTGRPDDMSPKAALYLQLSKVFPEKFNTEPPFDRHDWYVLRPNSQGGWDKVRYVIDYYGGPDDAHGMPTFFLDVRPALDSVGSAVDRFNHWVGPVWKKTLGEEQEKK